MASKKLKGGALGYRVPPVEELQLTRPEDIFDRLR
jgi:hypothetical protein